MRFPGFICALLAFGCSRGTALAPGANGEKDPGLVCPECQEPVGSSCVAIENCKLTCDERILVAGTTPPFGRGSAIDVAVEGSIAVVLTSLGLETYDVLDRDRPVPLGYLALEDRPAQLALEGTVAWIAAGASGVLTVDLSDPSHPSALGRFERPASGVEPIPGGVLLIDPTFGLAILDRDGGIESELALEGALRVTSQGDRAYVAAGEAGLYIVDISARRRPFLLSRFDTPSAAENAAVFASTLFVSDGQGGVRVVDAIDPLHPIEIGTYGSEGGWAAHEVIISGDRAYVAAGFIDGFRVLDVSDPTAPALLTSLRLPSDSLAIAIDGDDAFIAGGTSGLLVLDTAVPRIRGRVDDVGVAFDVALAGDRAFVADGAAGVRVVDVRAPSALTVLASISTQKAAHAVAIEGDLLYAVGRLEEIAFRTDGHLEIIDVSNLDSPRTVSELDLDGWVARIVLADGVLFVSMIHGPLVAIDVHDPEHPEIISWISIGELLGDLDITDGIAVVTRRFYGFAIFDVSDPSSMFELARIDRRGLRPKGLARSGDRVFVADGEFGLGIYDVADPRSPQEIGRLRMPGVAIAVSARDGRAVVVMQDGTIRLFDVRDPTQLRSVAVAAVPGSPSDVEMTDEGAFLAGNEALLTALSFDCGGD